MGSERGRVRAVRGVRRQALQRQLPRAAAGRLLVDLERAQPGRWLTPQWAPDPRNANGQVEAAPATYRALVGAASNGLAESGHGADTILVGETAPQGTGDRQGITGSIDALRFLRQVYCLDDNLNLLKGTDAQVRGCPQGNPAQFVAENPALFRATGYAHHPYELLSPPARESNEEDWVTMADLGDLSRELRRIYARYGQRTQTPRGVPLYLTEYGYQTAPDPFFQAVSFSRQAAWLNEAEYIAARNPNVRALSQFLLVERRARSRLQHEEPAEPRVADVPERADAAQRQAQAVLQGLHHAASCDDAARATRPRDQPLRQAAGRPRSHQPAGRAAMAPSGSTRWRTRRTLLVSSPRHDFNTRITVPRSGFVRLRWVNGRKTHASRAVRVTVVQ